MEKTFENLTTDEEKYYKLNGIYTKAMYEGDFGDILETLSFEELTTLVQIAQQFLIKQEFAGAPGAVGRLIIAIRNGLKNREEWEADPAPEHTLIIRNLQKDILTALDKCQSVHPETEKAGRYMEKFLAFLESLDDKQKGPNATDLKIESFVKIGPEQAPPSDDKEGKVIISFRLSFEENLAFIQEHINAAIRHHNLKETDLRLRRKYGNG